jgi:hypothetical protein
MPPAATVGTWHASIHVGWQTCRFLADRAETERACRHQIQTWYSTIVSTLDTPV